MTAAISPERAVRILVTGSRTWTAITLLRDVLASVRENYPTAVLVHGGARGVDQAAAAIWAGWNLPTEAHPAEWTSHGRAAGFVRNQAMVDLGATVCLAFIRDRSRGAEHCAARAEAADIPTRRIREETTECSQ
jgi:hypothetical protein